MGKIDENIIDFGSWTVPCDWTQVTLKQFQEIEKLFSEASERFDVRKCLHILTKRSEDEINALPVVFLEKIMDKLSFLQEPMGEMKPSNKVEINGEVYCVHTENKLKVGEYIASDTVLKGDSRNYAALMAILCRRDGEAYDSRYENEVLEDRIKMWESQPITKVLPIINFFLQLYITSMSPTLLSSKVREALDLTRKDIETLQRNGEISRRCMKSAMKKLRKLEKSISSI